MYSVGHWKNFCRRARSYRFFSSSCPALLPHMLKQRPMASHIRDVSFEEHPHQHLYRRHSIRTCHHLRCWVQSSYRPWVCQNRYSQDTKSDRWNRVANVHFRNGSTVNIAKVEGPEAYRIAMKAAVHIPSYAQINLTDTRESQCSVLQLRKLGSTAPSPFGRPVST